MTPEDRQFLEDAQGFFEKFANQQSSDPEVRLKTAKAYRRMGAIRQRFGQSEHAVIAYRQALAVSSKLAAEFPDSADYRQDLAQSYSSLGGWGGELGLSERRQEIEQGLAEALRLQEQLVHEFPTNLDYQRDLGSTYFRLGYIHLFLLGRPPAEAEEFIRQALAIRKQLVAEKPNDFISRIELGMTLGNLGNLLTKMGRYKDAEEIVHWELELRQKLFDDFPTDIEAVHTLGDGYMDLAELRTATGEFQAAAAALRQELRLRKKEAADFPSIFFPKSRAANCSVRLGDALRKAGAQDDANAAYEEAIEAFKELVRRKPYEGYHYVGWGEVLARAGASHEAVAAWEQAVQRAAENAGVANKVAWFLATASEAPIQNPAKTIQLAEKAVALEPQNGDFWNTLGAAFYRAGQWQDAVTALEKSLRLRSGGNSEDWFFLAMAHWQLGDAAKARHWYDQAIQWMDENRPNDEELHRFRAEAAALLGIPKEMK
jgi:tetratricopeptide (TPR) repeat protein